MKIIIKNIAELVQTERDPKEWIAGADMQNLNTIEDAFVEIENGLITGFGSMHDWTGIDNWSNTKIIDAEGGSVFPTYCDSHTHLVFAESREEEFVDRIKGLSYQEIASKGGGILNSAEKLRHTNEDKLFEDALTRLNKLVKMGTGAIEIKSGYGLTLESELKILKVIRRLKETANITIKSTFLGAHAIPKEFKDIYGIKESKFKNIILAINLKLLKYTRPLLPPFFRLIAPARWASQRLRSKPDLRFSDKAKY